MGISMGVINQFTPGKHQAWEGTLVKITKFIIDKDKWRKLDLSKESKLLKPKESTGFA